VSPAGCTWLACGKAGPSPPGHSLDGVERGRVMLKSIIRRFANWFQPRRAALVGPFPRQTLVILHRHYLEDACCHQKRKHIRGAAQTVNLQ
jgi:hypothetical protein